jgi:lipid-A-disaccharide synthase
LVFLIAGEPSGDALGAPLMSALRRQSGGAVRFAGLGGDAMAAEGLRSLFPITELSVMGIFEVLPRAPALMRRMREVADTIRRQRPAVVVSIDSPAFCAGVWRRLRGDDVKLVHYVAPTVWAWRPGRAAKFARYLRHLLVLLPFEPPYFERVGLPCTFVGHPVTEGGATAADGAAFRARHGLDGAAPVIGVLPGSRKGEVTRLLPPFGGAVRQLAARHPDLRVVIPAASAVIDTIRASVADWPGAPIVETEPSEKYHAMAACDLALAASGTVTLELALAGVPMVVGYRINPLTAALVRGMLRVDYVCLINLLLGRGAVPELLQGDCRAETLAAAAGRLLDDATAREDQRAAGREAVTMLRSAGRPPSERAAEVVLEIIGAASTGIMDTTKGVKA